ncbi:CBS domain-containing protein [Rhodoferax sp. AJA081-3]|uniref:CBS domain-containing protein n=1 Tax=Rhodoferax sp. AJA081-3 TaxID=2752316 RepID=UPI001ADFAAF9|nr:CBS domain-containing protein [Rhodoferax sp. AJA081-3]QTN29950.1 CBS domain-containing protein [Rhodoferax sp. AJA081-3]
MFSVYGKAGRTFRGTLEELRQVGPITRATRTAVVAPIGMDPQDQNPSRFADLLPAQTPPAPVDVAHRTALAAYEQTRNPGLPRHPLTRVDAVMSSAVVTIADTSTVEQAWQVLAQGNLGQAPVVDAQGLLIGLFTRAELLRPERLPGPNDHSEAWAEMLAQSVVDVMWTPVPSVSSDADIRRVARVLLDSGLPGLPVADDDGRVIGFVSRSDILRAVVADPPLDLWT